MYLERFITFILQNAEQYYEHEPCSTRKSLLEND